MIGCLILPENDPQSLSKPLVSLQSLWWDFWTRQRYCRALRITEEAPAEATSSTVDTSLVQPRIVWVYGERVTRTIKPIKSSEVVELTQTDGYIEMKHYSWRLTQNDITMLSSANKRVWTNGTSCSTQVCSTCGVLWGGSRCVIEALCIISRNKDTWLVFNDLLVLFVRSLWNTQPLIIVFVSKTARIFQRHHLFLCFFFIKNASASVRPWLFLLNVWSAVPFVHLSTKTNTWQ